MSAKLKAGSMDMESAFIDWLRGNGYSPAEGVDPFLQNSDFVRSQLLLIHDSEKQETVDQVRQYLKRRSTDSAFAGQFPVVYHCVDEHGQPLRYTITLTLSDEGAEWVGRVWNQHGHLCDVEGSGSGPQAHYLDLARMHIESQIRKSGLAEQGGR